jgi:hypothetical protein
MGRTLPDRFSAGQNGSDIPILKKAGVPDV